MYYCIIVQDQYVYMCTPPGDPAASNSYLQFVVAYVEVENVCMSQDSK